MFKGWVILFITYNLNVVHVVRISVYLVVNYLQLWFERELFHFAMFINNLDRGVRTFQTCPVPQDRDFKVVLCLYFSLWNYCFIDVHYRLEFVNNQCFLYFCWALRNFKCLRHRVKWFWGIISMVWGRIWEIEEFGTVELWSVNVLWFCFLGILCLQAHVMLTHIIFPFGEILLAGLKV